MTKHTIEIEGLPEGWEAVAYRSPKKGDQYLHQKQIWKAFIDESYPYMIVQKTKPREITLVETDEFTDALIYMPINLGDVHLMVAGQKIWRIKEE